MHTEIGSGKRRIVYLNEASSIEVSYLFNRIMKGYNTLQRIDHQQIKEMLEKNKVILTDERSTIHNSLFSISFSMQDLGIYVGNNAYQKSIAKRISHATGLTLHQDNRYESITVGIRDKRLSIDETYFIIKEIILFLPTML